MARIAYFDCFSGVSGDMMLGALLDLGLPLADLQAALGSLALEFDGVTSERVLRSGVSATKFRLRERAAAATAPSTLREAHGAHHHHHAPDSEHHHHHHADHHDRHDHHHHAHSHGHHSLKDIAAAIERSALSRDGKDRATQMFRRLAEAEAAVHDMPVERVHLHEVGALDSIVDIVGAVYGLEWLGASHVVASPLNVGSGVVECDHGTFPVPAPATARLLQGAPAYAGAIATELTTPTGALLVTTYAESFGPLPLMRIDRVGYGAGDKDFKRHPNVFRLILGETEGDGAAEPIVTVECEIDDMNPQLFGPLMDRLYAAGALDVFYAPVQMKKSRPGTLVTVIARPERRDAISGVLFAETTTIGVRYREMLRECLEREVLAVDTPAGRIRFKIARRGGQVVNAAPEFEDCVQAAAANGLPVKEVQALALKAWLDRTP